MNDNISPEEKLLRLIRGQKKPVAALAKKSTTSITVLKPTLNQPIFTPFQKRLSGAQIQTAILMVFIISLFYFIFVFVYPVFKPDKMELPRITQKNAVAPKTESRSEGLKEKPFDFYLQAIKDRQIFGVPTEIETRAPAVAMGNGASESLNDINLQGIISGENPQAIIVDKKTQKTYYVTQGQFIGEFRIVDIQEGKIIISYKGQKFEIYL